MTWPTVTELPRALEPVSRDPFLDGSGTPAPASVAPPTTRRPPRLVAAAVRVGPPTRRRSIPSHRSEDPRDRAVRQ
jgi:hypothetical protein